MHAGMVVAGFQKEFDTLDHGVLEKMKHFGFPTTEIKWFENLNLLKENLACIDVFCEVGTFSFCIFF